VPRGAEKKVFASAAEEAMVYGFEALKLEGPPGKRVGLGEMLALKSATKFTPPRPIPGRDSDCSYDSD